MSETAREIELSFVAPVYNEAAGLEHFYQRLKAVAESLEHRYEILFINDGSTDGTGEILRRLAGEDRAVRFVEFSRNFGHQAALTAGYDYARGQAVVALDSDCQHPPELIPRLLEEWRKGAEVVYTVRTDTDGMSRLKRWVVRQGYRLLRTASGVDAMDQADFRLLDRKVVQALQSMREQARFLRGMVRWVGFRQVGVPYTAERRHAGTRTYTWRQTLRMGLAGLLNFSLLPLRAVGAMGLLLVLAGLAYLLIGGLLAAFTQASLSGLAVLVLEVGGLQLLGLAAVGEYVGRVYEEAKGRPLYVVRDIRGFESDEPDEEVPKEAPPQPARQGARFTVMT